MGVMQDNESKRDGLAVNTAQVVRVGGSQFASGGNVSSRGWAGAGPASSSLVLCAIVFAILCTIVVLTYAAVTQHATNVQNAHTAALEAKLAAQASSQKTALQNDVNATVQNIKHGLAADRTITYIAAHASVYTVMSSNLNDVVSIHASVCKVDPKGSYIVESLVPSGKNSKAGSYIVYNSAKNSYITGAYTNAALVPELVC